MLGPFRIRNLRRSPSLYPVIPGTTRPSGSSDAVVCVDGDAYEDSIGQTPEAKLKYIDSDKDMVTVGSKEELADRLAEPIRPSKRSRSKPENASVPLRPASPEMHVFEIDHMEAAIRFWRSVEIRYSGAGQQPVRPEPLEPPLHTFPVEGTPLYPSLEEKRANYFKNSQPPQLHTLSSPQESGSSTAIPANETVELPSSSQEMSSSNVLTTEGIKQAQQAGEMLRARLAHASPYPQRNRVSRATAVNSWATYSKTVAPTQTWGESAGLPKPSLPNLGLSQPVQVEETHASFNPHDEKGSATSERLEQPLSTDHPTDAERTIKPVPGSLRPSFFENVQASLDKLSPKIAETRKATMSERARGKVPEDTPNATIDNSSNDVINGDNAEFDSSEALEITLAKMVFKTIQDMAKTLETMNEQFDTLLTPKLVAERLKSKKRLLPTHRQDTVQDMFALRRSIEAFALEVAETKQTLARLDESNVFPEGTNLMDFNSMTSAAYTFGRLIRSLDDMIITARRGMLTAQLADGEPKYHTPRRLARHGYEDVWSINIVPMPSHYTVTNVHNLVDEIRSEYSLGPLDVRQIVFREGLERSVEIEIEGKTRAVETWSCLLNAPKRSIRLPLSERQITLTRKHYPDVVRYPGIKEQKNDQATTTSLPPPSRTDIDVARLKALQDRRAAWRREFKARTQSVRFAERPQLQPHIQGFAKANSSNLTSASQPDITLSSNSLPNSSVTTQPGSTLARASSVIRPRQGRTTSSQEATQHSLRRAQSVTFGSKLGAKAPLEQHPEPLAGPTNTFHRLRYPPGPFAPPPPQRLIHERAAAPSCNTLPYDPIKETINKQSPNGGSELANNQPLLQSRPSASQHFVPAFPPLPPLEPLVPERRQPIVLAVPKVESVLPSSTVLPGAWPETEMQGNESSGAFASRMMGRSPGPSYQVSPISSPTLPATQPAEDMQRPVSPISLSARKDDGAAREEDFYRSHPLRRHASTIQLGTSQQNRLEKSAGGPWSRRPYSMTFDGSGRTRPSPGNVSRQPPRPYFPPTSLTTPASRPTPIPDPPSMQAPSTDRAAAATAPLPASSEGPEHGIKVQECVDQLKQLGYGDVHNGGIGRLVMYAQITNGDLEATIDMIEEEREAWQAHGGSPGGDDVAQNGTRDI